jgi:UDP-N-acetylglucosamine diphosphorylase/glucosamine-1-phosphate N-acetyltransferase
VNFHHTLSTQNIVIIEPQNLSTFQPLTQLKPLSLLQWAGGSLFDALSAQFPEMSIHIWGNDDFKSIAMERHKVQFYNHKISGSTLFISSQFFPSFVTELFDLFEIEKESIFQSNHQFAFAFFENPPVQHEHFLSFIQSSETRELPSIFAQHFMRDFASPIINLHDHLIKRISWLKENNAYSLQENGVFNNAKDSFQLVSFDTSNGPIWIGKNVEIEPFSHLLGPLILDDNCTVKSHSRIASSGIGRFCKVSGEISVSQLMAYSNKAHSGFLGHSILSSWVNFGADTNTSNLKNNYSPLCFQWNGFKTEFSQFLGSVIGEHCKTAINTQLNTGTTMGAFSNLFSADFPQKEIPTFSWGDEQYNLEKAIETARIVMERREISLLPCEEAQIRKLFRS